MGYCLTEKGENCSDILNHIVNLGGGESLADLEGYNIFDDRDVDLKALLKEMEGAGLLTQEG